MRDCRFDLFSSSAMGRTTLENVAVSGVTSAAILSRSLRVLSQMLLASSMRLASVAMKLGGA